MTFLSARFSRECAACLDNSKKRSRADTSADAGGSRAAGGAAEDPHQFGRRRARARRAARNSQVSTPASTPTTPGDHPAIAIATTPTAMAPAAGNATAAARGVDRVKVGQRSGGHSAERRNHAVARP
jgi:hypothetical protein